MICRLFSFASPVQRPGLDDASEDHPWRSLRDGYYINTFYASPGRLICWYTTRISTNPSLCSYLLSSSSRLTLFSTTVPSQPSHQSNANGESGTERVTSDDATMCCGRTSFVFSTVHLIFQPVLPYEIVDAGKSTIIM
jgi:hypothetical protein